MKFSSRFVLIVAATPRALVLAAALAGCSSSPIRLQGSAEGDLTYGSTGVTTRLNITAGEDGAHLPVMLSPQPSAIVVSPTTVTTDDDGKATAFALVPYGVEGVIVVSAAAATAAAIPVRCDPVSLCELMVQPETGGGSTGSTGQVYSVSAQALRTGPCGSGPPAPAGVSLTFAVVQPSGSGSTSGASGSGYTISNAISSATVPTDSSGKATANLLIPWGANALVQVAGGGSLISTAVAGLANPLAIDCLSWARQQNSIYKLSAKVVAQLGTAAEVMSGVGVTYSVIYPRDGTATVMPATSVYTDSVGVATAFVTVASNTPPPPIVVEAVSGSSALTATIDTGDSGRSGNCTQ